MSFGRCIGQQRVVVTIGYGSLFCHLAGDALLEGGASVERCEVLTRAKMRNLCISEADGTSQG